MVEKAQTEFKVVDTLRLLPMSILSKHIRRARYDCSTAESILVRMHLTVYLLQVCFPNTVYFK